MLEDAKRLEALEEIDEDDSEGESEVCPHFVLFDTKQ